MIWKDVANTPGAVKNGVDYEFILTLPEFLERSRFNGFAEGTGLSFL